MKRSVVAIITMIIINFVVLSLVYVSLADSETEIFASYDKLVEVETRIINNYVEDVTPEQLQQSALKGMLSKLDPYSRFISPAEYKAMQNGESIDTLTGNVGIGLTRENSLVSVLNITYGSPAYLADIMPGDKIFEIDGEMILEPNVYDVEKLFRGEVGSEIELRLFRPPSTVRKIKLKRAEIEPVNIPVAKMMDGDIGYIRVAALEKGASTQLRQELVKLNEQKASAIILDLRDNGDGVMNEGIQAADLFIPEGDTITRLKSRRNAKDQVFQSNPIASTIKQPMVVIINQGTGKAAEVMAAAIKETERGIVVGEKSFGAAVEQTLVEIDHGAALRLTTGSYYSPLGNKISGQGVEPHIVVEVSVEEQQQRRQNEAAAKIDSVAENTEQTADSSDTDTGDEIRRMLDEQNHDTAHEEKPFVDTQLQKAIDILKVIKLCENAA